MLVLALCLVSFVPDGFWATACKTVRPMHRTVVCPVLSCLSVLSVLSVTLVYCYCSQTVGWIKQTVAQQVHSDSHYKKLLNTVLLLQGSCSWLIFVKFVYGTSVNLQVFTLSVQLYRHQRTL